MIFATLSGFTSKITEIFLRSRYRMIGRPSLKAYCKFHSEQVQLLVTDYTVYIRSLLLSRAR